VDSTAISTASNSGSRTDNSPSYLIVLASGLASTALTLLGVYLMDITNPDFHIMGWYGDYVIPAGAFLVGIVAALGYGAASWISGIKVTRALIWVVLLFQIGAYFGAEYIEFKSQHLIYKRTGEPVGFFKYFDYQARSFAWKNKDGSHGRPLGIWGYAFRGLEILGFALGGLMAPVCLWKAPHCHVCQRYMRRKSLALVPGSVPQKKIKKKDEQGLIDYRAEQQKSHEAALELLDSLRQMAGEGRAGNFQAATQALNARRKETGKLPVRYKLDLISCTGCAAGWMRVQQLVGQGKEIRITELERTDVPPDFAREIRSKKG